MALKKKTITGVEGMTSISDSDFFGADIFGFFRSGQPLFETDDVPIGKKFKHEGTELKMDESIPISKVPVDLGWTEILLPEQFTVIYRN